MSQSAAGWVPDWAVPAGVRAIQTERGEAGASQPPFDAFNLADHVGDAPAAVAANRAALRASLALPAEPGWLRQVHGARVVALPAGAGAEADAAWTDRPGVVCAVLTADCLPVLMTDDDGTVVAAAHAGWRGLAAGVLEATVAALPVPPARLRAWLGPAIGPTAFEVGPEVRAAFLQQDRGDATAFRAGRGDRWWADLPVLARRRLLRCGVGRIDGGTWCTVSEPGRWYSHRRDGRSGRMASLIWRL